ncbi:hypothetical protein Tco_0543345 [Tanacetum coccineum]
MLAPSGGGRKAHLLEDKQIPSVRVFSTWMAFGGNTLDLGSFGEKTDEIKDLHQILEEVLLTARGDGVAGITRRRRDPSGDGVKDLVNEARGAKDTLGSLFWGKVVLISCAIVSSPDYVPGPEHPPSPVEVPYIPEPKYPEYLVPSDDEAPMEDQPLPADASPEDHADYLTDGGDNDDESSDDDDDDDTGDEDEEPFEDEEEEEHLAPAVSSDVPITDPVPSAEDTKALETDKAAPTPVPSPRWHTAMMFVRPQTLVPLPSEAEVERLLALPIPPPSLLTPLSSPLTQIPSPPLPPPPSSLHLPPPVPTSLPLPLSPLPPLLASLFIPPVDRREDTPEAELPPRKRLCLTAPAPRYEVGESLTVAPRSTGGYGADYGFIGTVDAEVRRQRVEEVGYGIRDVWVDPTQAVEKVAPTTLEGVNDRVTELAAVQEQDTQDIYAVIEATHGRQT